MTLRLSTKDAIQCSALLCEVRAKAESAAQSKDSNEALAALLEVRNACVRAAHEIREARQRAATQAFHDLVERI